MGELIVFESADLIPSQWNDSSHGSVPVRCFNPALVKNGFQWIMAYRFVGPDQIRKIALCRLTPEFKVIPNSAILFSDLIHVEGRRWFADPRFFYLQGNCFIYWNSGWEDTFNRQFLQQVDLSTMLAVGPAREIKLKSGQNKLEKNWMFFDESTAHAVYTVSPHCILSVDLSGLGDVMCETKTSHHWDLSAYAQKYGDLRGGCPPQKIGDRYYSLCHSVSGTEGEYRYVAAFYCFSATSPFKPLGFSKIPLELPNPWGAVRDHPKLNPAVGEVIYPCSAYFEKGKWVISYGINDEYCAVTQVSHDVVLQHLNQV